MIEVRQLNKTYDRRRTAANRVLRDVSFTLPDRGFVCILGPSGCGKTSLLNAMGGLDDFDNGALTVDELTVDRYGTRALEAERNRNFGYIFQNYYLLENHSVAYNVYLGLHSLKLTHAEKLKRVRQALAAVDMERYIRRTVGELSGGQQQRVAIARALARRPRVIFADEPTGNLDEDNTRNICTLLRRASKDSLVIMVTHEERIARFFADRIITLNEGRIAGDSESWQREALAAAGDKTIYTADLSAARLTEGAVTLRLFQEPGAAPAELTVAVLKDRIVLKLADPRAVTLGAPDDPPRLVDGPAPSLSLEEIERTEDGAQAALFGGPGAPQSRPGRGITLPVMFREARHLKADKKVRRVGMRIFLVLLTVLTLLTAGDFIALSRIDPEDYISSDSHILAITVEQGPELSEEYASLLDQAQAFYRELLGSGQDLDLIPPISVQLSFSVTTFLQLGSETLNFPAAYSFAPVGRLEESSLLYGRMPERTDEIVVDRLVLEAMLNGSDSIVKNAVRDLSVFLGAQLPTGNRRFTLSIVGISDCGDRTVYVSQTAMLALRNTGSIKVISLSELKALDPQAYGGVTLAEDECLVNYPVAGEVYMYRVGHLYTIASSKRLYYTILDAIDLPDLQAAVVVSDTQMDEVLAMGLNDTVYLYCADKAAVKSYLQKRPSGDDQSMLVWVRDPYQTQYDRYVEAVSIRADARTIVTATVLAVCLVMLYLLCRTQVQGRIELLAVYRLLGIPRRKLHTIFLLEGALSALTAIIPTAILTWGGVMAIHRWTEIELPIVLPWRDAGLVSLGILAYYLLVSVLPLFSLLRLPPARLAVKYDM